MNESNTSNNDMPHVNLNTMKESRTKIKEANNNLAGTQYVDLATICKSINNNVNETYDLVERERIEIRESLRNTEVSLQRLNNYIKDAEEKLESTEDPNEREKLEINIQKTRENGDGKIERHLATIEEHSKVLRKEASDIEYAEFKQEIEKEEIKLTNKLSQIEEDILYNQEKRNEAKQEYDDIDEGMKVLEEFNIFELFSDTIPTEDELTQIIGSGDPRLGSAIIAVGIYKKFIDVTGEGFTYSQMAKLRTHLYEQIQEYDNRLKQLQDEKKQIGLKIAEISYMSEIDSERFIFTKEVKNLAEAYEIYTNRIRTLMENDTNYDNILEQMAEMLEYINSW